MHKQEPLKVTTCAKDMSPDEAYKVVVEGNSAKQQRKETFLTLLIEPISHKKECH